MAFLQIFLRKEMGKNPEKETNQEIHYQNGLGISLGVVICNTKS